MISITHDYGSGNKPNFIIATNYFDEIYLWYLVSENSPRLPNDVGMWRIKYKKK